MGEVFTIEGQPKPIDEARHQLQIMEGQFKAALPAHIPVERFARVVMTALQNSPLLLKCERRSLWNAAMKAAQDGLLPDGREGAMAPYKDKRGNFQAQWMPMILGLRKKARNSGEIATWDAHCVYENDEFAFELGDEPFIRHKPALGDRGKIIAAYSIAVLKDGSKSREVMSIKEIEGVRLKSKAQKGPWDDAVFYPEMVRKTVARRHSKMLPMSSDLDDLIRRDDDLYDLPGARQEAQVRNGGKPQSLASALDNLAKLPAPQNAAAQPAQQEADAEQTVTDEEMADAAANEDRPTLREKLLAEIEQLNDTGACTDWALRTSAQYGDLLMEDAQAINTALLARQNALAKKNGNGKRKNAADLTPLDAG